MIDGSERSPMNAAIAHPIPAISAKIPAPSSEAASAPAPVISVATKTAMATASAPFTMCSQPTIFRCCSMSCLCMVPSPLCDVDTNPHQLPLAPRPDEPPPDEAPPPDDQLQSVSS